MPKFPGFFRAAILLGQFLALATHPQLQAYFQVAPMGACDTCPYNEIVVPVLLMPRVHPKACSLTMGSFIFKDVQPQPRQGSPKRLLQGYVIHPALLRFLGEEWKGAWAGLQGLFLSWSGFRSSLYFLVLVFCSCHLRLGNPVLRPSILQRECTPLCDRLSEFQICHLPKVWFWRNSFVSEGHHCSVCTMKISILPLVKVVAVK